MNNYMELKIPAISENEAFARVVVAAFAARCDPTMDEISDVKTAVSEAVTNAVIHGYADFAGEIVITATLHMNRLEVTVIDRGAGIADLEQARRPLYTSRPELERSGMGFAIMENFMDELYVSSEPGKGTVVKMVKAFRSAAADGRNML